VGNVNERYSELVADSLEIRDEPGLQTRVEAAHWLIEEKEAWSGQDGASESNALLLLTQCERVDGGGV
jgi:hypothetical protein